MTVSRSPSLYNQSTLSDDDFVANFVARDDVLKTLLRRLRAVEPDGCGLHHILIGARGMGKTMLLRRLAIAIKDEADLAERYVPLRFREEQYNVLKLGDFWRNCGEALAEWAEGTGRIDLAERLDAALHTKTWSEDEASAEQFHNELAVLQRRAVLLVDNLDLILNALSMSDHWTLRRHLQMRQGPIMIGAATRPLKESADQDAAFYEFFQPHYLDPLDERETESCMRALARRREENGQHVIRVLDQQPERLKTLHTLTGGNPRVLALIYRLLETAESEAAMADLEILLDQVTPYYKARVEEYQTPQQRAIIDAIALHWDPITTGDLSRATNVPSTTLSPLLMKLRKDGLIESIDTSGSYAGHQLVERFLNIWYLMRHGTRRTKQKMRWLVAFLTSFYSSNELAEIALRAKSTGKNWHVDYAFAFEEALACQDPRRAHGNQRGRPRSKGGLVAPIESATSRSGGAKGDKRLRKALELSQRAFEFWEAGDWVRCQAALDELVARFGNAKEPDLRVQVAIALFNKAATLGRMGDSAAATAAYDDVVARFGDAEELALREQVAMALVNKAVVLGQMGDNAAAIAAYDQVVTCIGNAEEPPLRIQAAIALSHKAIELGQMGDGAAEIAAYDDVVARFGDAEETAVREQVAIVLVNKAIALGKGGDSAAEIAAYDDVLVRFGDAKDPALREWVAKALVNRAITLGEAGDSAAEIVAYEDVLARFGDAKELAIREQLAVALVYKGITLSEEGDSAAEIAVYDDVLVRFGAAEEAVLREQVAIALVNKAITLDQIGDSEAAIAAYDDVVARFGNAQESALREEVGRALVNKAATLAEMGDSAAAVAAYDNILARFGNAEEPPLRIQAAIGLFGKAIRLGQMGDNAAAIAAYDDILARFGDAGEPALREQVAKALVNKAHGLSQIGENTAAVATYEEVVARFSGAEEPVLREAIGRALINKAIMLARLGDSASAISAYDNAVDLLGEAHELPLREHVLTALFNKAITLGRMGDSAAASAAYDDVVARFGKVEEPAVRELVGRALVNKAVILAQSGENTAAVSAYDRVLDLLRGESNELLATLAANTRIRLANLLLDSQGDMTRPEALYLEAASVQPLSSNANLAWLYLLADRVSDAVRIRRSLDELPSYGLALLDAAMELARDNFGSATRHMTAALSGELETGEMDFSDDIERLLRLAERKGYGERLLEWFEETGFGDRIAPVHAAFKAYIRGERVLLDVNPEVRQPAKTIFDRLEVLRRQKGVSRLKGEQAKRKGRRAHKAK